jgi:chromosome segregation ATPase
MTILAKSEGFWHKCFAIFTIPRQDEELSQKYVILSFSIGSSPQGEIMSTHPRLEARVSAVERRQTHLEAHVEELATDLTASVKFLSNDLQASFDQLVQYHIQTENQIDTRFNQVDARFNRMDTRFNQVDTRFNKIEEELTAVRTELKDDIAAVKTELKDDIAAVRTELKDDMAAMESRILDALKQFIAVVDSRLPLLQ